MASKVTFPSIKRRKQYGDKESYVRLIHKTYELLGISEITTRVMDDEEYRIAMLHITQAYEILGKLCEKYPLQVVKGEGLQELR